MLFLRGKINNQSKTVDELTVKCSRFQAQNDELSRKHKGFEFDLKQNAALIAIKDRVCEVMRQELNKLQQYTRQNSVTVAGMQKPQSQKIKMHIRKKCLQPPRKKCADLNGVVAVSSLGDL